MENRRNYYRILQVQPDAPVEVIKASYRAMMRELKLHPDLGGEHWNAKVLNEAYATLSHPRRRAAYDKKLYQRYTKNPNSPNDKQPLVTDFCPFCQKPLARLALVERNCPNCNTPLKNESTPEDDELSRRSMARITKSGMFRYQTSWPQKAKEAKLVDISPTGMRFLCDEPLKPGLHLKITCTTLQASAKVVNVNEVVKNGGILYAVGVSFLAVTYVQTSGSFYSVSA